MCLLDDVISALDAAGLAAVPFAVDWMQAPLSKLIDHIVATHHPYVKQELPRLAMLAQKVVNRHGETQAHLPAMQQALSQLDEELTHHLAKGRSDTVSLYRQLFEASMAAEGEVPDACFGTCC